MKKLVVHGKYNSDGTFSMNMISGENGNTIDDWNLATNAIRMRTGTVDDNLYWDVGRWDEKEWG